MRKLEAAIILILLFVLPISIVFGQVAGTKLQSANGTVVNPATSDNQTNGLQKTQVTSMPTVTVGNFPTDPATSTWQQNLWSAITGSVHTVTGNKTPADGYANPATAIDSNSFLSALNPSTGQWYRLNTRQTGADGVAVTDNGLIVIDRLYGYNGSKWDMLRSDITNGLDVDPTRLPVMSAATNTAHVVCSPGNSAFKTNVLKAGSLTTSAVTAEQIVTAVTYTVTATKTFYLQGYQAEAIYSTVTGTSFPTNFGTVSMETPAGTKIFTNTLAGIGMDKLPPYVFAEPVPIAAGVGVWVKVTPAATTSTVWRVNYWGYEK